MSQNQDPSGFPNPFESSGTPGDDSTNPPQGDPWGTIPERPEVAGRRRDTGTHPANPAPNEPEASRPQPTKPFGDQPPAGAGEADPPTAPNADVAPPPWALSLIHI